MVITGLVLLIIGFALSIPVLWAIGVFVAAIGVVLAFLGSYGHLVGGRAHWF
ncbi:hypothetical protein [Kutzneria sp. CA-103260]|uniref:hypothetical protein n=1 Tax=Kutzneria sp. CA-103260 TaxID=2802641 RepID=UPI001BEF3283|nr:hypothetical protein [Kutzneria sp. CA-103260]QUQ65586.1 hypothetical protein JJ691_33100 [Kutzneria sp. CA-103260]